MLAIISIILFGHKYSVFFSCVERKMQQREKRHADGIRTDEKSLAIIKKSNYWAINYDIFDATARWLIKYLNIFPMVRFSSLWRRWLSILHCCFSLVRNFQLFSIEKINQNNQTSKFDMPILLIAWDSDINRTFS